MLRPGDKGLRVRVLQRRINGKEGVLLDDALRPVLKDGVRLGWRIDPGPVDGAYGDRTLRAVKSFELMHGLRPDGKAGAKVLRRLRVWDALKRIRRRRADRNQVISRERWGAAPARGPIGGVTEPTREHFAHCTVSRAMPETASIEEESAAMRGVQAFHQNVRGWFDVGYSFVVFPSGRKYEGRGWGRAGAHTEGRNSSAYATAAYIPCAGEPVSEALITGIVEIGRTGIRKGALARDVNYRGHRDVAAKSCPGDPIYDRLGEIERRAR